MYRIGAGGKVYSVALPGISQTRFIDVPLKIYRTLGKARSGKCVDNRATISYRGENICFSRINVPNLIHISVRFWTTLINDLSEQHEFVEKFSKQWQNILFSRTTAKMLTYARVKKRFKQNSSRTQEGTEQSVLKGSFLQRAWNMILYQNGFRTRRNPSNWTFELEVLRSPKSLDFSVWSICDSQCKQETLKITGCFLRLQTRPVTLISHEIFRLFIDVSMKIHLFCSNDTLLYQWWNELVGWYHLHNRRIIDSSDRKMENMFGGTATAPMSEPYARTLDLAWIFFRYYLWLETFLLDCSVHSGYNSTELNLSP